MIVIPPLNDLTGKKFGKLTVIERAENRGKKVCWLCLCECGEKHITVGTRLTKGLCKSCGCLCGVSHTNRIYIIDDLPNEEWVTIKKFPNYEVSNMGRVRNAKTKYIRKDRDLKGYRQIGFKIKSKIKLCLVHRLVLENFKPCDNMENLEVNHLDENKSNNKLENLEWCTRQENVNYGTARKRAIKKTSKKVKCIEKNIIYDSLRIASEDNAINYGNLSSCCNGKLQSAGGYHWEYV